MRCMDLFKAKCLGLVLAGVFLSICVAGCFYGDGSNFDGYFSGSVVQECFSSDYGVSRSDVILSLDDVFGEMYADGQIDERQVTVRGFLEILCKYTKIIMPKDSGFVYVLGDSKFMSQDEFDELCGTLNRKLNREQFDDILSRLRVLRSDVVRYENLTSQDDFSDLIHDYYREFASLYDLAPGRARYWIGSILSGQCDKSRLSNVLHEMAHEESAVQGEAYLNKSIQSGVWRVFWRDDVSKFNPYNLDTGEFVPIDITICPGSLSVLNFDDISSYVQSTAWFRSYVVDAEAISNKFGIYGMVEEFCANMIDIRFNIISAALGYNDTKLSDGVLVPYYFWTSLVCSYLTDLNTFDAAAYERLIGDQNLVGLLRSVYGYVNAYVEMFEIEPTSTWTVVVLKNWYMSEKVQNGIRMYLV